jgi:alpha-mannosidase
MFIVFLFKVKRNIRIRSGHRRKIIILNAKIYQMNTTRKLTCLAGLVLIVILLSNTSAKGQFIPTPILPPEVQKFSIINGYSKDITGEVLEYHSCHPDANSSLLIRCLNDKDRIEWLTDSLPADFKGDTLVFAWIGGFSSGTSKANHQFHVFINDRERLVFNTYMNAPLLDWTASGKDGISLVFRFNKLDIVKDQFGYMFLKIPRSQVKGKGPLRLRITGDNTGSRDWYMTMRYGIEPKVSLKAEAAVFRGEDGKAYQRLKVSIDHFNRPIPVKLMSEGKVLADSTLSFGLTYFYLRIPAVDKVTEKELVVIRGSKQEVFRFKVNPVRNFTVYLLPHSHVDIGYTALQTEVEQTQIKNIGLGIDLARRTADYPDGARFRWSPEVLWPVDLYLRQATPEMQKQFIEAVQKGWIGLDGTYANELTALCHPEELYRMFDFHNKVQDLTGTKIETAMITDVPGYTWGMVTAMAQNGIKYFSVGANNGDRIGHVLDAWGDKPFWWVSASGKERILIWLAGTGYALFHRDFLSKGDGSTVLEYLASLDAGKYPYDMVQVRYTTGGDNGYPDPDLPDFVKRWNEKYISPKFRIANTAELFHDFLEKYQDKIPVEKGDFTPYWEDGAASSARETAMNRASAERLTQAEVLYSLLNINTYPSKEFEEAWRQVVLYSEHTWGAWNSISEPDLDFVKGQWKIKQGMALKADSLSKVLAGKVLYSFLNAKTSGKVLHFRVFNTNSWTRTGMVTLPKDWNLGEYKAVCDEKGVASALQQLSGGEFVFIARDIPAFGSKLFKFLREADGKIEMPKASRNVLSNDRLMIKLDEKSGEIVSITHIGKDDNLVMNKEAYGLNAYIYTGKNAENPLQGRALSIIPKESGPVLSSILVKSNAPGCRELTSEIRLMAGSDKIEIINTLDKNRVRAAENVRFAFPFSFKKPEVRMNLAWGDMRPEKDQLRGANRNYYTIQHFLDITEAGRGVTIASPDTPLWEMGSMSGEAWMNPVPESARTHPLTYAANDGWAFTNPDSPLLFSWVMNNSWHTNYKADQEGLTTFRYSLLVHGDYDPVKAYRFGIEESQPLVVFPADPKKIMPDPLVQLDEGSGMVVTSIRPGKDHNTLMIRLFNPSDKAGKTALKWRKDLDPKAFLSQADESNRQTLPAILEFQGFEVKNVLILNPWMREPK